MATRNLIRNYFGGRLRIERERRGWSQAHVSELLEKRGVNLHSTAVAKVEAKQRDVRIDEAVAIADMLDMPLDALLGRGTQPGTALAYVLRNTIYTARRSAQQISGVAEELDSSLADLDTLDFNGRKGLETELHRAQAALRKAQAALENTARFVLPAGIPVTLRKDLAVQETRTLYAAGRSSDETES
jgi:transcriptional regulator with XRE-family HTH domain